MSERASSPPDFEAPVQNGFLAEAIARHFLGDAATWLGGRNAGFDVRLGTRRIDVKSGVRQRRRLAANRDSVETIGIRLNKGLDGLLEQDVDDLLVVVRDGYVGSTANVVMTGTSAHVRTQVEVENVAVYLIPKDDMATVFRRPFNASGQPYKNVRNVDAPVEALDPFRMLPPS